VRTYPAQSTITLKLNWQSFVNQGIPNDRVEEMLDALNFMRPRVLFSNNAGATWQDRSPPVDNELRASGTPAVHKLTAKRWMMSFPVLDETNLERTGRVLRLESLNDGVSWTELES